jgi:uncharacterized protein HemX
MIDLTVYLSTVAILSAIIVAFISFYLTSNKKDLETKRQNSELMKQIKEWEQKNLQLQKEYSDIHLQQDESVNQLNKTISDLQNELTRIQNERNFLKKHNVIEIDKDKKINELMEINADLEKKLTAKKSDEFTKPIKLLDSPI